MLMLKCLGGMIAGAFLGFGAALLAAIPLMIVDAFRGGRGELPNTVGNIIVLVGAAIGFAVPLWFEHEKNQEQTRKKEAEDAARAALARRQEEELQRGILEVRQLCSDAQVAALALPVALGSAELALDRAGNELREGLYSPFWEAMEAATAEFNRFDVNLKLITRKRAQHQAQSATLGRRTPPFTLGVALFPDPKPTHERLRMLYRTAQKDAHFANVYEQRRIASKVDQTNVILIAGFSSLNDAVERLGDRIVSSMNDLGAEITSAIGSLESALEAAADSAARQRDSILNELQHSTAIEDNVRHQLRRDAERRSEHEREVRIMLDNIQRRRHPFTGERY
jgi:hypothetical protein